MTAKHPKKRRLAAILSADVAGYSRLMHEDEEGTLTALHQARGIFTTHIEQFGGRVVDTAGDSVLADFPSVVDATRCAIAVQQGLKAQAQALPEHRRMLFRIGISLGDVLVDKKAIYGDGVNIAARVQTLADPGGVCLSGVAYNQVKNKLKLAYEFTGKQQVKNINDPVPIYRIAMEGDARPENSPNSQRRKGGKRPLWLAGLAAALVAAFALWDFVVLNPDGTAPSRSTIPAQHAQSDLPALVVLPFENLGPDTNHRDFADGITEDIITDLSRVSGLLVLSSNTSFRYRGQQVQAQDVGAELTVDYVLQGSIRRIRDTVRVNVQLVDAVTGFNRWAGRYDRQAVEVFDVQNEISHGVANALAVTLTRTEQQRLAQRSTASLAAYNHFLEGQRVSKQATRQANEQARAAYRRAIEIDPAFGRAYGGIAFTLAVDYLRGWSDTPLETLERALELAKQAVVLNSSIPQTHWVLGYVYLMRKEHAKAEQAAAESINVAPNYADGYGLLALINNNLGRSEQAIEYVRRGMRLNPYYTWDYPYNLGRAYYSLGRYPEAITALEQAQERNENAVPIRLHLAASYVRVGRMDDAEWQIAELQVLNPNESLTHTRKTVPITNPALLNSFLEDLRKAGLPE